MIQWSVIIKFTGHSVICDQLLIWLCPYRTVKLEGILTLKQGCLFIENNLLFFPHDTYVLSDSYPQTVVLKRGLDEQRVVQVSQWAVFGGGPRTFTQSEIKKYGCNAEYGFSVAPI